MDPSGAGGPPAGWYPDPAGVKAWRWWDGTAWTSYASDPSPPSPTGSTGSSDTGAPAAPSSPTVPGYPTGPGATGYPTYPGYGGYGGYGGYPTYPGYGGYGVSPGAAAAASMEAERRSSVWATRAIVVYVVCQVGSQAVQWSGRANLRESFHRLRVQIDTGVMQPHTNLNASPGRAAATDLFLLGLVASAILFLVWQHRSASTARLLSLPATHSPAMGVGSWFIPVVNLWFPYQALRDCFPSDDNSRRLVLRMWLCWVALPVVGIVNVVTIFVGPSSTSALGLAITVVAAALSITIGILLVQIVHRAGEVHGHLAASYGYDQPTV